MADMSYLTWSADDLMRWIISLDDTFPEKYEQILTQSFSKYVITGADVDELDREDLLEYGIVDLEDRRKVYKAMSDLIVHKKKRRRTSNSLYSNDDDDDTKQDFPDTDPDAKILSLSDDEDDDLNVETEDKLTLLAEEQRSQLEEDGYCVLDDPMKNEQIVNVVYGFVRDHGVHFVIDELIRIIVNFYSSRYNESIYAEIVCKDEQDPARNLYFLAPKTTLSLCCLMTRSMEMSRSSRVEIDVNKVSPKVMQDVLRYLGHHKGKKPEEIAKPIRSTKMDRIVADKWDAVFVNEMNKKEVFLMITAANYLDIPCLLHLGCAKIATLIKGKSPEEIRNILKDDHESDGEESNEST